jgi:hypothetical protein
MTGRQTSVDRRPQHLRPNWFLYDGRKSERSLSRTRISHKGNVINWGFVHGKTEVPIYHEINDVVNRLRLGGAQFKRLLLGCALLTPVINTSLSCYFGGVLLYYYEHRKTAVSNRESS